MRPFNPLHCGCSATWAEVDCMQRNILDIPLPGCDTSGCITHHWCWMPVAATHLCHVDVRKAMICTAVQAKSHASHRPRVQASFQVASNKLLRLEARQPPVHDSRCQALSSVRYRNQCSIHCCTQQKPPRVSCTNSSRPADHDNSSYQQQHLQAGLAPNNHSPISSQHDSSTPLHIEDLMHIQATWAQYLPSSAPERNRRLSRRMKEVTAGDPFAYSIFKDDGKLFM